MKDKKLKMTLQEKGFTLVELLISIAIVGLMATVVVVNFRAGQKEDILEFAARQMATDIRSVQTSAFSGERVNGVEPTGYGLRFDEGANVYAYFIDSEADELPMIFDANDTTVRVFTLPQGITIESSVPTGGPDVFFVPPRPSVFINGNSDTAETRVTLKHQDVEATRTVIINRISGKIDVQ